MYCPKCGEENRDDAKVCGACNSVLTKNPAQAQDIDVKNSGMAITALVLGILSIFTCGITAIPAIILGIVGLVKIEKSGGSLTGRGFAIAGIIVPVLSVPIIALLMGILMPAMARTRQIAFRMTCGTNLSFIGKAMLIYSNDYDDELPRSAGRNGTWKPRIPNWQASNRFQAHGVSPNGQGGQGSISSCFYLLIKYAEVTPRTFICKGDTGTTEFSPYEEGAGNMDLIDFWDFGDDPTDNCSYSYHMPFGMYALTTSSEPGMPVAADRNPFIRSPMDEARDISLFEPEGGTRAIRMGNAIQHQEDGQNVLFLDSHVEFVKSPNRGIDEDNIYTFWDGRDIRRGSPPTLGSQPMGRTDSLLVHDGH